MLMPGGQSGEGAERSWNWPMDKEFPLALLKDKPVRSYIMFGLNVYDLHDLRS